MQKWAIEYISEIELLELDQKIKDIESKTMAEIVPMIVRRTIDGRSVQRILFFIFWLALFLGLEFFGRFFWIDHVFWMMLQIFLFPIAWVLSIRAQKFPFWITIFFSRAFVLDQVYRRAAFEFYSNSMNKAQSRAGVLFLVSIEDRAAAVYAEPHAFEKIDKSQIQLALQDLIQGCRSKEINSGFKKAIDSVSGSLIQAFPVIGENQNELSNHLIIKD